MKYLDFRKETDSLPLIRESTLPMIWKGITSTQAMRNQLSRWRHKGLLLKLKRGIYTLTPEERKLPIDQRVIACELLSPSYISLEWAISYYGFIPEGVFTITLITAQKTQFVKTPIGHFQYRHIKPSLFTGFYQYKNDQGVAYFLATPEKALFDFLYLNLDRLKLNDLNAFEENFRFQYMNTLNWNALFAFADLAKIKKLTTIVHDLHQWAKENWP